MWVVTCVQAGFLAFFLSVSIRPLESNTLPLPVLLGLFLLLSALCFGIYYLFPTRAFLRRGAEQLEVDSTGFTLLYSDGHTDRVNWDSNLLSFDLIDLSTVESQRRLTENPYSLRVRGVRTILTAEAYVSLRHEASSRNLILSEGPGSRGVRDASANPRFTRVRGPVSKKS
jgi:hypothetical protein